MSFFLTSPRLYFREVRISDIEAGYHKWMNDPEIFRFTETRYKPASVESLREYVLKTNENPANLFLAIVDKEEQKHIGNIKLGPINNIHRFADIGIVIGEKDYWGKGLATEAIQAISEFAFKNFGLNKITAGCYENNIGSIKAFQKAGFQIEYIQKTQYLFDGEFINAVRLCLFR